ncbi:hypothetical protein BS47DRAFT_178976 [Hydnum rufescens UP504]|uniref:Uncharacterized protein n=1 Tax=Hydnum rufescens UP504 TaxID=1448309 RepID=A0A9P6APN8_9AGAM|nr:hypothetical protein BS47DRAFT_178976 [Hydnum rufescens UP504]
MKSLRHYPTLFALECLHAQRGLRPFRRVGNSLVHFQKSKILLVTSQLALSWLCSYTKLRRGFTPLIPYNLFLLYVTATQLAISVFLGSLASQSDYLPLAIPRVSSIRHTRVGSDDPPRISKLSRQDSRHPSKTIMVLFVTIMQAIAAHIMPISHNLADTPTLYVLGSLVLLFTPVLEHGLVFQSSHQLASLLLMFCGVLLSQVRLR